MYQSNKKRKERYFVSNDWFISKYKFIVVEENEQGLRDPIQELDNNNSNNENLSEEENEVSIINIKFIIYFLGKNRKWDWN